MAKNFLWYAYSYNKREDACVPWVRSVYGGQFTGCMTVSTVLTLNGPQRKSKIYELIYKAEIQTGCTATKSSHNPSKHSGTFKTIAVSYSIQPGENTRPYGNNTEWNLLCVSACVCVYGCLTREQNKTDLENGEKSDWSDRQRRFCWKILKLKKFKRDLNKNQQAIPKKVMTFIPGRGIWSMFQGTENERWKQGDWTSEQVIL